MLLQSYWINHGNYVTLAEKVRKQKCMIIKVKILNNHTLITCRTFAYKGSYFISTSNNFSFSRKPCSTSPTTHSATPAGVPVKIRSPMFIEK